MYKLDVLILPSSTLCNPGNHESETMNKMYGFEGEVKEKYSSQMVELFTEVFNYLPLAHIIGGKILVRLYSTCTHIV